MALDSDFGAAFQAAFHAVSDDAVTHDASDGADACAACSKPLDDADYSSDNECTDWDCSAPRTLCRACFLATRPFRCTTCRRTVCGEAMEAHAAWVRLCIAELTRDPPHVCTPTTCDKHDFANPWQPPTEADVLRCWYEREWNKPCGGQLVPLN